MWLKKKLCNHSYFIEELHRFNDDVVAAPCFKCGTILSADCGLNIDAKIERRDQWCQTCKQKLPNILTPPTDGSQL
jgi:hypothetical protein